MKGNKQTPFWVCKSMQIVTNIHALKRTKWLWLFLVAILLRVLLPDEVVETLYGRSLFPPLRMAQGFLSSLFGFPLIYLLLLTILAGGIWIFVKKGRKKGLWFIFSTVFSLGFTFLLLWGYNYNRVPFEKYVKLPVRPLGEEDLESEFEIATAQVLENRRALGISLALAVTEFPSFDRLNSEILPGVRSAVGQWGYPAEGSVRARLLYPKGVLLRFSSSGVYLPWTGEGHIDAGLYPLNWPFVMAHEMSHGYGMANEGVCNFIAYQVCLSHPDPFIRYAGALYYWRYAAYEMKRFCPAELQARIEALPKGIRLDLEAIRDNYDRYPDLIPQWKNLVYDSFLKSQGLKEGVLSYETVLVLVHAWRSL